MKLTEELVQAYQLLGSASGSGVVVVVFDGVAVLEAEEEDEDDEVEDEVLAFDLGMVRSHSVVSCKWALESLKVKEMVEALWEGFEALKMEMLWRA